MINSAREKEAILKTIHTLTYEVMDCRTHLVSETVATYPSYNACLDKFYKILDEAKHAKIDLVVRDGLGSPIFRTSLLDMSLIDKDHKGYSYSDPYGWFGTPSVYNSDYKDAPNSGYEFYTHPTKQWS